MQFHDAHTSLKSDPFIELLMEAHEEHAQLTKYEVNEYGNLVMYWTCEEFSKDYQGGRVVMSVKRNSTASFASYIVNHDGYVTEEVIQAHMCAVVQSVWKMLLTYGHVPISWSKASGLACEYVCLCMCLEFYQFRLCDANWKADSFATLPTVDMPEIKQESTQDKINKAMMPSELVPPMSKCVHVVAVSPPIVASPSAPLPKKTKEIHHTVMAVAQHITFNIDGLTPDPSAGQAISDTQAANTDIGNMATSKLISAAIIHKPTLTISNLGGSGASQPQQPLKILQKQESSELFHTSRRHNSPSIQQQSAWSGSTPASATSSTTDLVAQMANASLADPSGIVVPAMAKVRVAFMKTLANSLQDGGDASGIELANTKVTRESALASSVSMRSTARGICHADWVEANPDGSHKGVKASMGKQPRMNAKQAAIPDILQIAADQNSTGTSSLGLEIKDEAAETHIESL
ncbi:hypothetical protein BDN67DRAFT_984324 [Paxillus ammoniavirescens]|nr:hypothetical protein BDN67DRAFT_984324 [Paxillus ammoniavirescens]